MATMKIKDAIALIYEKEGHKRNCPVHIRQPEIPPCLCRRPRRIKTNYQQLYAELHRISEVS